MNHPWVHYLPLVTTTVSAIFFVVLLCAARARHTGPHLWWWAFGVLLYGMGTLAESTITLTGNTVELTKAWYIFGALLGGYPLAQGTVYLLLKRRTANILSAATLTFVVLAVALVVICPVDLAHLDPNRPTGTLLAWRWVRLLTPVVNSYAMVYLVGGAIVSALRFRRVPQGRPRVIGNVLIAVGALLPGIGGSMAKAGIVEALYVLELLGLVLIWLGYGVIMRSRAPASPAMSPLENPA